MPWLQGLYIPELRVWQMMSSEVRFGCVIIKEELEFSAADFPAAGHFVMEILYARTLAFLFHSELF